MPVTGTGLGAEAKARRGSLAGPNDQGATQASSSRTSQARQPKWVPGLTPVFFLAMNLSSTYTFDAPRQTVWNLLTDPTVVADCLPGCESLVPAGDDSYTAVLNVGIASVTGRYEGRVRITDQEPPERYRLVVDGKGRPGFVLGEASVELSEGDGGQTVVTVDGRGQIGGTIARIGQRLVGTVGKTMMDRFFECLRTKAAAASG